MFSFYSAQDTLSLPFYCSDPIHYQHLKLLFFFLSATFGSVGVKEDDYSQFVITDVHMGVY